MFVSVSQYKMSGGFRPPRETGIPEHEEILTLNNLLFLRNPEGKLIREESYDDDYEVACVTNAGLLADKEGIFTMLKSWGGTNYCAFNGENGENQRELAMNKIAPNTAVLIQVDEDDRGLESQGCSTKSVRFREIDQYQQGTFNYNPPHWSHNSTLNILIPKRILDRYPNSSYRCIYRYNGYIVIDWNKP